MKKGNYYRAFADYGEAIRLDPTNALRFETRGDAYADKFDYARAIVDYDQAIQLARSLITIELIRRGLNDLEAFGGRGSAHLAKGELIIDLDQNRTLERWGRKANIPGLTVKAIERDDFTNVFRETTVAGEIDHILIDLAGAREATVLKAIARSELVIIPAQAS
jgi:tetratricopeptide (TPR) repeat protein